jgi:hypothetical protein
MHNLLNNFDRELELELNSSDYFKVEPEAFGLDRRSFGYAYTDGYDYIIINKIDDKSLRYYGGFEYTNDCDRQEYGNWVIYSSAATRVYDALEAYREIVQEGMEAA